MKVLKLTKGEDGLQQHLRWNSFCHYLTAFSVNGQFSQIFGQVFRKSCKLPVDKEKLLTNITKNPILDGAGVLQAHLGGAFLV